MASTGSAHCTKAVHKELVTGRTKSSGQFGPDPGDASFQFVEFPAFIALKVMMVLLACDLVVRGIAWDFNRLKPSFLNQRLDVSIHRRNPERRMVMLSFLQGLFRRQRPVGPDERLSNRSFLSCIPFFHGLVGVEFFRRKR